MSDYNLVQWNDMDKQIAEAKDIEQMALLTDKLEAIRVMAKQSKQSLEVQNRIAEYRLKVERKKGQWLDQHITHEGSAGKIQQHLQESMDSTPVVRLSDIGITKDESSKAQRIAKLTEAQFNEYLTETKGTNQELTVSGAVRLAKQIIREDTIEEQKQELNNAPPARVTGKYEVVVIDPPWNYGTKYDPKIPHGRSACPYPEMNQGELLDFKIPAADDCVLWLWTTNAFMKDAYELLEEWGFVAKTILTWDKVNIGVGYWLRNVTEHCILAVKGSPVWDNKTISTILHEKRTQHSAKPEGFYTMVDKICYGNRIDIFARKKRKGWEVYGDEVN